jgi:hypothetical protein
MVLPFALIFTGYMFKDDLQIISKIFGEVTEAVRDVTTGRAAYQERTATPLNEVATTMPEQIKANGGNDNDNDADNMLPTGRKVTFANESSEKKLPGREEEASITASYPNKKPVKMSGSADSDSDDDSQSSNSSAKVGGSSSSSSSSDSAPSTKTYDDDDYSSSEESPAPKRKRQS